MWILSSGISPDNTAEPVILAMSNGACREWDMLKLSLVQWWKDFVSTPDYR